MEKELIVLKWGSDSVTDDQGMDEARLNDAAREIDIIRERYAAVVVSSGAVAVGKTLWTPHQIGEVPSEPSLQVYAMMGSGLCFSAWQKALSRYDIPSGQLLVTHNEINSPIEKPVLKDALRECIKWGIVPVINENDALSIEELAKLAYGGDNDGIAGHIAELLGATTLIIFTGKGGMIDENGEEVRVLSDDRYDWAKKLVSSRQRREDPRKKGRGGMASKLHVCHKYAALGIRSFIAQAGSPIDMVLEGETGTEIVAKAA